MDRTERTNTAAGTPKSKIEPLCDIIILTLNQLDVLKPCVESVLKYTDIPARLIIVNNGGGESIRRYCESLKPTEWVNFIFHHFDANLGFVRGNNIAVKESRSPYVCLLNNDCVVTPGWLRSMIALSEAHPEFGVINPESNTLVTHRDTKNLSVEARAQYYAQFKGQYNIMGSAVGFCMLIQRKVVDKVGLFDEGIEIAYFEDTDFCLRAKKAGYQCAQAKDVYVHHQPFGKSQSVSLKRKHELIAKNRAWFYKKWGKPLRIAMVCDYAAGGSADRLASFFEYARQLGLADNRVHMYVHVDRKKFRGEKELRDAFGVSYAEYPNLKLIVKSSIMFRGLIFACIAFKWRKTFDVILSDDLVLLRLLSFIKFLFRFKLLYLDLKFNGAFREIRKIPSFIYRTYVSNEERFRDLKSRIGDQTWNRLGKIDDLFELRSQLAGEVV